MVYFGELFQILVYIGQKSRSPTSETPTSRSPTCLREREREEMANTEVEALDFEPEDDNLMDEDGGVDADAAPLPKLKSAITGGGASAPKRIKGRGFRQETDAADRNTRLAGRFVSLDSDGGPGPERCQSPSLSLALSLSMCVHFFVVQLHYA